MTRSEFLTELRKALENDLSGSIVQENVEFYNQYITDEIRKGKSEEDVLSMLGDPWILARTVIDAADGTDQSTVYESGSSTYGGYENDRSRTTEQNPYVHTFGLDTWWKKLLLILGIIMIVVAIFAVVTGLIRILAPILVPILVIMIVVRMIGNRRG